MDAERFPEAAAYLARLPDGLASYPQCEVKGSVVRELTSSIDATIAATLPSELRTIIAHPPPVSAWVAEVPINAMILVQYEALARSTGSRDAMIDRAFEASRALLSTPLYKILFLLVSPDRLITGVEKRWGALRRGTSIAVIDHQPKVTRIRVSYPRNHYNRALLSIRAASVRAALVCAGGKNASVTLEPHDDTSGDFVCRWE